MIAAISCSVSCLGNYNESVAFSSKGMASIVSASRFTTWDSLALEAIFGFTVRCYEQDRRARMYNRFICRASAASPCFPLRPAFGAYFLSGSVPQHASGAGSF